MKSLPFRFKNYSVPFSVGFTNNAFLFTLVLKRIDFTHLINLENLRNILTCAHRRLFEVPSAVVAVAMDLALTEPFVIAVALVLVHGAAKRLDRHSATVSDFR